MKITDFLPLIFTFYLKQGQLENLSIWKNIKHKRAASSSFINLPFDPWVSQTIAVSFPARCSFSIHPPLTADACPCASRKGSFIGLPSEFIFLISGPGRRRQRLDLWSSCKVAVSLLEELNSPPHKHQTSVHVFLSDGRFGVASELMNDAGVGGCWGDRCEGLARLMPRALGETCFDTWLSFLLDLLMFWCSLIYSTGTLGDGGPHGSNFKVSKVFLNTDTYRL